METIKNAIKLLNAVHGTMEKISVIGIDNQDKFVGCANAVQTVSKTLEKYLKDSAIIQESSSNQEVSNGR